LKATASSISSSRRRHRGAAHALAGRVQVLEDPAITARGAKAPARGGVEVLLKNGKKEQGSRETPRGQRPELRSPAEIVAKFERLASRALAEKRVRELRGRGARPRGKCDPESWCAAASVCRHILLPDPRLLNSA